VDQKDFKELSGLPDYLEVPEVVEQQVQPDQLG